MDPINIEKLILYSRLTGLVIAPLAIVWKASRSFTLAWEEATTFMHDIRQFMTESRVYMKDTSTLIQEGVGNHLTHIEKSLETIAEQGKEK
jgi:hypothetical protein